MAKARRVAQKLAAQEIEKKVGALRALVTTHAVMLSGNYPPNLFKEAMNSIAFIEDLHRQLQKECLANPEIAAHPAFQPKKETPDAVAQA